MSMLGLAWELDPHVKPNHYRTFGGARKAFVDRNNLGLLWPNFQLLSKQINYQYLTNIWWNFWAQLVETLVLPSVTTSMLISFGLSLLIWDRFYKFLYNDM